MSAHRAVRQETRVENILIKTSAAAPALLPPPPSNTLHDGNTRVLHQLREKCTCGANYHGYQAASGAAGRRAPPASTATPPHPLLSTSFEFPAAARVG